MSLQFSDTTNKRGIVQLFEKEIGAEYGDISSDSDALASLTADVNLAWDHYLRLAFESGGQWQFDDSNHTDYPIIYINLVANQRSYSWTVDENSNLILDIYRVAVLPSATDTIYVDVDPVDVQSGPRGGLLANDTTAGIPSYYDKTANGIFFDPPPSYSATNGLKIYINREASYFTTADTTKKPGCPGNHHKYFVLRPAYDHARRHNLAIAPAIYNEVLRLEELIRKDFSRRERDVRKKLTMKKIRYV